MSGEGRTKVPVWIKVLLVVSLAANLAVAGVFAGAALREPDRRGPGFNLPLDGFRAINRAMAEEDRKALLRALRDHRDTLRAGRSDLRETRREFVAALRAEPFSEDRLNAALDRQAELWGGMNEITRMILVARIVEMEPDARRDFADNLEHELTRKRGKSERKPAQ